MVVVCEERGTISFCFNGNIVSNLDGASLRQALLGLFGRKARKKGGKKISTPTGRASYASLPGRLSSTPTPLPTAVAPSPSPPTATPPPAASAPLASSAPPSAPDPIAEPMSGADEPEPSASTEASETNELPESPPPKGRGPSSPEEANEE